MTDENKPQVVPMQVWRPDGPPIKVSSIASQEAHLGNLIYEGHIPEEEYYPRLVVHYRSKAAKLAVAAYKERKAREDAAYSADWIKHWLEGEETLNER